MMIDALFVDELVILPTTALIHSVTPVMNSATLHKTSPTRFPPQEHNATKKGLIPGHETPTTKGTDHNLPTMGTVIGDISTCNIVGNVKRHIVKTMKRLSYHFSFSFKIILSLE